MLRRMKRRDLFWQEQQATYVLTVRIGEQFRADLARHAEAELADEAQVERNIARLMEALMED